MPNLSSQILSRMQQGRTTCLQLLYFRCMSTIALLGCYMYDPIINFTFDLMKGCDGSVLLICICKGNNKAEKNEPPSVPLHTFYVINSAKKALEEHCPAVVSCTDILAMVARDAVVLVY
ncbi:peroxidase 64-like [Punica granatum]|uniref:peroxidase n=1 Tax=Punica granatum TaxID=22663 RepID=A0A6P8CY87_PUNGR|nr:peroxidase 64-like [Punica granatum]